MAARRTVGAPSLGDVQGQVGWGSGQPELLGGSPAHGTGLGLGGLSDPFQPKPSYDTTRFYDIYFCPCSRSGYHVLPLYKKATIVQIHHYISPQQFPWHRKAAFLPQWLRS